MGEAPGSSTHDLLLAMAGQVDDDLLAWARELVAVGENTRAIALVTAGVTADRTALPTPVRTALVTAARAAQTDLDADSALPAATDTAPEHRFAADPSGGDERVAAAVGALPVRLLDGTEVLLAWRLTPAGSAPGPLPHPVVLVEVGPGGRPADVLAYQLSVALDRAGVVASVEVLTSGNPVSEYHTAARAGARRVHGAAAIPAAGPPVAEPAVAPPVESAPETVVDTEKPEPGYADLWAAQRPFTVSAARPSERDDAAATDPTGDVVREITPAPRPVPLRPARDAEPAEPEPRPTPRPFERRRTTVTPLTRSSLPSPVPLARRDGSRVRPLVPVSDETPLNETPLAETPLNDTPSDESATEATDAQWAVRPNGGDAYSSLEQGQIPALADTPMFRSMQDPLSGPLNAPLLAPLLDPTPFAEQGFDEQGRDDLGGVDEDEDDDPFGLHGISPLAPDRPTSVPAAAEDRWANEWASGDWAVSSSDLEPADLEPADLEPAGLAASDLEPSVLDLGASRDDAGPGEDEAPRHRAASEQTDDLAAPPVPLPVAEPPARVAPPVPFAAGPQLPAPQPPAPQPPAPQPLAPQPLAPQPAAAQAPTPLPSAPRPSAPQSPAPQSPAPQPSAPQPHAPQARPESPAAGLPRRPVPGRAPAAPAPESAREEPVAEGLGLRPDSVARLSDADRELLARLQAELGTGTRPRTSRRAGVAAPNGSGPNGNGPNGSGGPNGNGPNGNGSGRQDPPDLAG